MTSTRQSRSSVPWPWWHRSTRDHRADLGDRLLAHGAAREALGEYLAYRSLQPHDQANAHYRLARAHFALAETEAARREVLLALEIAPSYTDALRLLLDINASANETADP